MPKSHSDSDMMRAIKSEVEKLPPPEFCPPELLEEVFKILQNHQYHLNRNRSRDLITRLIESKDWG